jgi:hypothetical protein
MTKDWPTIKNKELSVVREIEKLKKIQRNNMLARNHDAIPKRKNNIIENTNKGSSNITTTKNNSKVQLVTNKPHIVSDTHNMNIIPHSSSTYNMSPEDQWEVNNKLLIEGYEEMYNNISEDDLGLIEELAFELMNQVECEHDWIRGKGDYNIKCAYCIYCPSQDKILRYFRNIQRNGMQEISLQTIIDHGLVHAIYGTLEEVQCSDLGKFTKEACKRLSYLQGRYKIVFYSIPPRFTQPIRPASHDIYITKGIYLFPSLSPSKISQEHEELFFKNINRDNWRIFNDAKELEGNIKFDPEYFMIYQNKIIRIFLLENYNYNAPMRAIGRLITPNFGKDS